MKKAITFRDVQLSKGGTKDFGPVLKKLNISFEGNSSNSIVSETKEERNEIIKLLLNPYARHRGEISFEGDYFSNRSIKNGEAVAFISNEQVDELSTKEIDVETLFNNTKLNSKRQIELAKEYLKTLIKEKNELTKSLSMFNDPKQYNVYLKEKLTEFYKDWFLESEDELQDHVNAKNRIAEIDETILNLRNELKEVTSEYKFSKEDSIKLHKSKSWSISKTYKSLMEQNNSLMKKEKVELFSKKSLAEKPGAEAISQMQKSIRAEALNLTKYVQKLPLTGFEINSKIKSIIKIIEDEKTRQDRFDDSLNELMGYLGKFKKFLNNEHIQDIDYWVEYIDNISDFKSALNSKTFNEALSFVRSEMNSKIRYYKQYINDIDESELMITSRDKQEKEHQRRELWEFKIISLRFQKQIYIEKLELTNEYNDYLQQLGIKHTKQNYELYYEVFEEYLEKMMKTDLSLNKWRFLRDIRAIAINTKIEKEIISEQIKRLEEERKEQSQLLMKDGIFEFKSESYPIKLAEKITPDYELTESEEKDKIKNQKLIEKQIKKIDKLIIEQRQIIKNEWNEEIEDKMWRMMEDFGFKNDFINEKLNTLSVGQIQKVLLIKLKLEGYEIIVIEDPSIDFELGSTHSIKTAIDKMNSKHETMIIVLTNNINTAADMSTNMNLISKGSNVERGLSKTIINNPVHPFTKVMIKSVDKIKFSSTETSFTKYTYTNLYYNMHSEFRFYKIEKDHEIFVTEDAYKRLVK